MPEPSNWEKMFKTDEDLARFMRSMKKFNDLFCDMMSGDGEFTLRLEVKGKGGRLAHCRVGTDSFDRSEKEK